MTPRALLATTWLSWLTTTTVASQWGDTSLFASSIYGILATPGALAVWELYNRARRLDDARRICDDIADSITKRSRTSHIGPTEGTKP